MNKLSIVIIAVLSISLLVLAGCVGGTTGAVPSAPPAPSGGGCGIGAPAEGADAAGLVQRAEAQAAF